MKRRLIGLLMLCLLLCGAVTTAYAADAEAYNAADVLYDLGLFSGTGTNADGSPNFDLDRVPTRHEAVTMLVSLLGKKEMALAGEWETPFTDVVDWAKPYVGYAYTHGLTSGTSSTTYGGNERITASQYLTFVLKALGYETGADFRWDKAWEFSDQLGLTDGRYNAANQTFLRGDVTLVSRNALDEQQKDGGQTLSEKLISEGLFTKAQLMSSLEDPLVLENEDTDFRDLYFIIDGKRGREGWHHRGSKGEYIVEPFWKDGRPVTDYEVEIEDIDDGRTTSRVWKNDDGTFTVDLRGDFTAISVYYVTSARTVLNDEGEEETIVRRTKTTLAFEYDRPYSGLYFMHCGETFFDGDRVGDNFSMYWVFDVYMDNQRISDYEISFPADAPFTVTKQADGTMLLRRVGSGRANFAISCRGESATYEAVMWPL